MIIPFFSETQLLAFGEAIVPCFDALATDRIASHVVEQVLLRLATLMKAEAVRRQQEEKQEEPVDDPAAAMFGKFCNSLQQSWAQLLFSAQGTHVLRAILKICCGGGDVSLSIDSQGHLPPSADQPILYADVLSEVGQAVLTTPRDELCELGRQSEASAGLQAVLLALHRHQLPEANALVKKLLSVTPKTSKTQQDKKEDQEDEEEQEEVEGGGSKEIHALMHDQVGTRLLQVLMAVCDDESFALLLDGCVFPDLVALAQHDIANFSVQDALNNLRAPAQAKQAARALSVCFVELLEQNKGGVLQRLIQACDRLQVSRGRVFKALVRAVQTLSHGKSNNLVEVLLDTQKLGKDAVRRSKKDGAGILQSLLQYRMPIPGATGPKHSSTAGPNKVAQDLLELSNPTLVALASDSHGSRVLETAMVAPCVAHASKQALITKLSKQLTQLGSLGPGAYVVERAFKVATNKLRLTLALELVSSREKLRESLPGRTLLRKCQIAAFMKLQRETDWDRVHQRRKWQLFQDFCTRTVDNAAAGEKVQRDVGVVNKAQTVGGIGGTNNFLNDPSLSKPGPNDLTKQKKKLKIDAEERVSTNKSRMKKQKISQSN
eukprot:gb/GEZN01003999.1/.p1 GENE.gb/GEZN01003999.1/~~gb/GEZN01003999.1/.p1  ORF type:complete len:642 (-),score=115.54 gb/GEZN01003999.1/:127-1941(-)